MLPLAKYHLSFWKPSQSLCKNFFRRFGSQSSSRRARTYDHQKTTKTASKISNHGLDGDSNTSHRPPVAAQRPRLFKYPNGRSFTDPFDWLQNPAHPDLMPHIHAENDYTANQIAPLRKLAEKISKDSDRPAKAEQSLEEMVDGYAYYTQTEPGYFPVYFRRTPNGEVQVVLDANKEASTANSHIGTVKVSPDHKFVAFTIDKNGNEQYDCIIRTLPNSNDDEILISNVQAIEWAEANHFFYTTPDALHRSATVFCQVIDEKARKKSSEAEVVFHEDDPMFFVDIKITKDKKYLTINSNSKRTSEVRIINARNPHDTDFAQLRPVWTRKPGVEYFINHGTGGFYMVTNAGGAANYQLLQSSNPFVGLDRWKIVIPNRERIRIEDLDLFKNFVAVWEREDGRIRTRILRLNSSNSSSRVDDESSNKSSIIQDEHFMHLSAELNSPTVHIEPGINANFNSKKLRFSYSSLIFPGATCDYDMERRTVTTLRTESFGTKFNSEDYVCDYQIVPNRKVPITIAFPKKFKRNGTESEDIEEVEVSLNLLYANFVLQGYGAYGQISDPRFSSDSASLLLRGCGVALAHVRGGGELGRQWYEAGRGMNKKQSIADFVTCGEFLQSERYCSISRLGAMGMSAGGLIVAAAVHSQPLLFSAVLLRVPFVDVLTTMLDSSLPLTQHEFDEWGDPTTDPNVFDYIASYDPYRNVISQRYPAMFLTASLGDPRVPYWNALKYVCALREAQRKLAPKDVNPILLRVSEEGGHFGSAEENTRATELAFLLHHINKTEYASL